MKYITVLTPPALMCAVVLFAVVAFLRREMRGGGGASEDHPEQNFTDQDSFPESGTASVPDTQFSEQDGQGSRSEQ